MMQLTNMMQLTSMIAAEQRAQQNAGLYADAQQQLMQQQQQVLSLEAAAAAGCFTSTKVLALLVQLVKVLS